MTKKTIIIIFATFSTLLSGIRISYAQVPLAAKPTSVVLSAEQPVAKPKSDEIKREELSKKLLERKNELRNERSHQKEQHRSESKEKSQDAR